MVEEALRLLKVSLRDIKVSVLPVSWEQSVSLRVLADTERKRFKSFVHCGVSDLSDFPLHSLEHVRTDTNFKHKYLKYLLF